MSDSNINSYIGSRFGKLVITGTNGRNKLGPRVDVICDCGSEKTVNITNLKNGHTKSCGCLKLGGPVRHGHAKQGRVNRTYAIYSDMLKRCYNENYREFYLYGGRGIRVCERWRQRYENFLEDMGARPTGKSLDRIDFNGDYCYENCRWATNTEQARNRRNNVILEHEGVAKTAIEWSEITGIPVKRIYARVKYGWSDHKVLTA